MRLVITIENDMNYMSGNILLAAGCVFWVYMIKKIVSHTTPEIFEKGGFTLKTNQKFSVHTVSAKFENATISGHFGFAFE